MGPLMKGSLFIAGGLSLIVGWDRWQIYRSMLPLPGAKLVVIYRLSPMPHGPAKTTLKGDPIYPLPHLSRFDSTALIDSQVTLGQSEADKVNKLLSSYDAYHQFKWGKLRFDAAYAIVMTAGQRHVEVLVDRSCSEAFILRYSPGKIENSGGQFGTCWYSYLKRVLPDLPEKLNH